MCGCWRSSRDCLTEERLLHIGGCSAGVPAAGSGRAGGIPLPDTGRMTWTATVRRAAAEALAVVFAVECAGCDAPDVELCDACRDALGGPPTRRVLADGLGVRSAVAFDGVPARVLRALKEEGRTAIARPLGAALRDTWPAGVDAVPVAVPSSRASLRRRGFVPVELIARRAGWRCLPLLALGRSTDDQRLLSSAGREENVAGAMTVRAGVASRVGSRAVMLLDDVVTTGATLSEAHRALRSVGIPVAGALTVASTPRRFG